MGVNRNDPCPCGSGKKYKHCHMRIDQAQARSGKSTRDVKEVITPETIPYFWWKKWNTARTRGEYGLLYDMCHEDGPFRTQFDSRVAFFAHAQSHPLPSGKGWELAKVKVTQTEAWVLSQRGLDDPTTDSVAVELMHLRRTPSGWRLWAVDDTRIDKPEDGEPFLAFDEFGLESLDLMHHRRVEEGYERPDLADHEEDLDASNGDADDTDASESSEEATQAPDAAENDTEPDAVEGSSETVGESGDDDQEKGDAPSSDG